MSNDYIDLNCQFETVDPHFKLMFQAENLRADDPIDISKAILLSEESQTPLKLSKIQQLISRDVTRSMRIIRRGDELKMIIRGRETPFTPGPSADKKSMRRRQTKHQWCYATTALMFAEDSGCLSPKHVQGIANHKPILYSDDPQLRYRFCGYDYEKNKYFCDPGQEYTVILSGDPATSCTPGSVTNAVRELTGRNLISIGNGDNTFWQGNNGKLNRRSIDLLVRKLTMPAILNGYINGDPKTQKGHSFLIKDFSYDGEKLRLYTEECVYGETPIIDDLTANIDCSVYEYRIKATNIYCFE